jgi:hypothetical protein
VAWLPPELELGEELELKPPEFVDPEFVDPESAEPELAELEPVEVEPEESLEPELDEPVEVDVVLSVDPGRARASAPAVTTLATVTAVVVLRTLARPRSRAATA